ncbi:hypothetical protein DSAG12_02992 [Promethearchaeum syntrophicum]|uniref:Uncharacterized protein n=1 Tax=Promethearchaeum syntrophicum TaxID=2594042 RepID=A0A5B9DED9_9ARCH|nr:hypothetical protein [Candidatus Prometheoarchaeum syntrophicum]QEE17160.1 hypothetical protein DSAG12_02992 [Candidatus Prometheoarchaeum syntrophicum]
MILQIIEVPLYAVILLLITGVAAILFSVFMVLDFLKNKKMHHLLWAIAFFVLFVAGVVLAIGRNYAHLLSPAVSVLAVFIPGGIAAGLFYSSVFDEEKSKKLGMGYVIFVLVGAVLILLTKTITAWAEAAKFAVMLVHIPSGLAMVILPFLVYQKQTSEWTPLLVSIGGAIIGLAGILLAFLVSGFTELTGFVFGALPVLLLIVALCFAFGFLLTKQWSFAFPFIKSE